MSDRALITKKLGRYDIIRVLGKGAMGVVYEARDPNLNRKVAIKTVRVNSLSKDEAAEYELRFRTEAHSAARLQHPNIVSVYDSDRDGDTPFLVMEFVKGEDLKHYLDTGQRYTLDQSTRMVRDLLSALDYAHQRKIIHRDIKPANLLIEADGRVKLTDFGVARIQDSGEATRTQGGLVGTLKYMSPEQVEGRSVDALSDLFSAGIVLYQLLTDRRPFDGDSYFSIVTAINSQDPQAPSSINPMLPPAIDAVVARALAKDKTQRFATAQDFSDALQAAARRADPTITPSANPFKVIEPMPTDSRERSGSSSRTNASVTGGTFGGSLVTQELELVYWKDVKDSNDLEDLEGFIVRFPDGVYADLAKRRLKRLAESTSGQNNAAYDATVAAPSISVSPAKATDITPDSFVITVPIPAVMNALPLVDLHLSTVVPTKAAIADDTYPSVFPVSAGDAPPQSAPVASKLASTPPTSPRAPIPENLAVESESPLAKAPAPVAQAIAAVPSKIDAVPLIKVPPLTQAWSNPTPSPAVEVTKPIEKSTPIATTRPVAPLSDKPIKVPALAASTDAAPPKRSKMGWIAGVAAALVLAMSWLWMGSGSKPAPGATTAAKNAPATTLKPATELAKPATSPPTAPAVILTETASTADPSTTAAVTGTKSAVASAVATKAGMATTTLATTATASLSANKATKTLTANISPKASNTPTVNVSRDTTQRPASAPVSTSANGVTSPSQQLPSASATPGISAPYKLDQPPPNAQGQGGSRPVSTSSASHTAPNANSQTQHHAGPREACEGKIMFSYGACMIEQCERPVFQNHAVCVERREQEARRKAADANR